MNTGGNMDKLLNAIEEVLSWDFAHLTTDDADGTSLYHDLKTLEDAYNSYVNDGMIVL